MACPSLPIIIANSDGLGQHESEFDGRLEFAPLRGGELISVEAVPPTEALPSSPRLLNSCLSQKAGSLGLEGSTRRGEWAGAAHGGRSVCTSVFLSLLLPSAFPHFFLYSISVALVTRKQIFVRRRRRRGTRAQLGSISRVKHTSLTKRSWSLPLHPEPLTIFFRTLISL